MSKCLKIYIPGSRDWIGKNTSRKEHIPGGKASYKLNIILKPV